PVGAGLIGDDARVLGADRGERRDGLLRERDACGEEPRAKSDEGAHGQCHVVLTARGVCAAVSAKCAPVVMEPVAPTLSSKSFVAPDQVEVLPASLCP